MDLLNENRSLIHTGKLLRQPDSSFENWTELFVLLFDNYRTSFPLCVSCTIVKCQRSVVFTKPRERDGVTKYNVNRRVRCTAFTSCQSLIQCIPLAYTH